MSKRRSMPPLLSLRSSLSRASPTARLSGDFGLSEPEIGTEIEVEVDQHRHQGHNDHDHHDRHHHIGHDFFPEDERSAEIMAHYMPSPVGRPMSMAIPQTYEVQGPYCSKRPTLSDILANRSPPPWTLSAFIAYLSQNHCLETLEFTMDADRYRKHYNKMAGRSVGGEIGPGSDESTFMQGLWQRLMQAHIAPNGAREVNLPSSVRDTLLSYNDPLLPPHPDSLNEAVGKVYELMEESVLVPFVNSFYPQSSHAGSNGSSMEDLSFSSQSYDDRGLIRSQTGSRRQHLRRASPTDTPLSTSTPVSTNFSPVFSATTPTSTTTTTTSSQQHRASAPSSISQFARSLSHSARHGFPSSQPSPPRAHSALNPKHYSFISNSSSSSYSFSNALSSQSLTPTTFTDIQANICVEDGSTPPPPTLTEDNASSPSALDDPTTPPATPPMADFGSPVTSAGPTTSGHGSRSPGNPWKRMRYSFGRKKKTEQQQHQQQQLQIQQQQQQQNDQQQFNQYQQQQTSINLVSGSPGANTTSNFSTIPGIL